MSAEIKNILLDKKILILGFGKEGQSSYATIRSWFPQMPLTIADRDAELEQKHPEISNDKNTIFFAGEKYLEHCGSFDLVIKSPGIPYDLLKAKCEASKISSQTDLFLRAFSQNVIGVTGTKGKSTTCSLIYHIFEKAGRKAILAGNIGIPPLDMASSVEDDSDVVFEMSSHQLEHIQTAPQTAVLLNVFPEHLDHYKDFTAYKMAKFNISKMQSKKGVLIYNADDPIIAELIDEYPNSKQKLGFSLISDDGIAAHCLEDIIVCCTADGKEHLFPIKAAGDLPGRHNILNLMAAILVCLIKGLSDDDILSGLATYKRLAHRLEFVGKYRGISFYDDSIATIPEACIEALNTLDKVDLLILGGYDRGLEYSSLYTYLFNSPVPYILFMGDAGIRMYEHCKNALSGISKCVLVKGMEEAFDYISANLFDGDVCLLSPAAASYGMFRNFEERGEVYKKMAAGL